VAEIFRALPRHPLYGEGMASAAVAQSSGFPAPERRGAFAENPRASAQPEEKRSTGCVLPGGVPGD